MPLDANTEYDIDRAKNLLDSYLREFGGHDQADLRVSDAAEILGRLLPQKRKKKIHVGSVAHVSAGSVPAAITEAALALAAATPPVKCSASFSSEVGWSCECGLPNPSTCLHAAGK